MSIKLTQYSKGSGCGCKIDNHVLHQIISDLNLTENSLLKLGNNEDAAIYPLNNEQYLLSTTDFFTPIVNDAFDFGRVAAVNALSDIYAMGGKPMMALSVLGWPVGKIEFDVAKEILRGAKEICTEAGIQILGGHSIESTEPIFGLMVNGSVLKQHLKLNSGAKPGDLIYLTKPIGAGILAAAHKRDLLDENLYPTFINYLTKLNSFGAIAGELPYVNALTDVTGFGLIGHLSEVCKSSNTGAELYFNNIKLYDGVKEMINQFVYPEITTKNYNNYKDVFFGFKDLDFIPLCDPQTSGGLLIFVDTVYKDEFEKVLADNGLNEFSKPIGKITDQNSVNIEVKY